MDRILNLMGNSKYVYVIFFSNLLLEGMCVCVCMYVSIFFGAVRNILLLLKSMRLYAQKCSMSWTRTVALREMQGIHIRTEF
jgi:hypothetical protein